MSDDHQLAVAAPATPAPIYQLDAGDLRLVQLWLDGRSVHTQRAYSADAGAFFAFVHKPLRMVELDDLHAYNSHLRTLPLKPGSRHRKLAAIKSLFAFGCRIKVLGLDVASVLRMPANKDTLNERILEEQQVRSMIAAETYPRNTAILRLLYAGGLRVSELVALTWQDAVTRNEGGQFTIFGKGHKTRVVLVPPRTWASVMQLKPAEASPAAPIFVSSRGCHLSDDQVRRIVRAAAQRVGINKPVSPHWLRHCHCSHALDHGEKLHVVQATVGHSNVATTSRYLHARPNESSSKSLD